MRQAESLIDYQLSHRWWFWLAETVSTLLTLSFEIDCEEWHYKPFDQSEKSMQSNPTQKQSFAPEHHLLKNQTCCCPIRHMKRNVVILN